MGLPFSLPDLIERVALPFQSLFQSDREDQDHVLMWDCYVSGQMTDAQLETEIVEDPAFADFVKRRLSRFH